MVPIIALQKFIPGLAIFLLRIIRLSWVRLGLNIVSQMVHMLKARLNDIFDMRMFPELIINFAN